MVAAALNTPAGMERNRMNPAAAPRKSSNTSRWGAQPHKLDVKHNSQVGVGPQRIDPAHKATFAQAPCTIALWQSTAAGSNGRAQSASRPADSYQNETENDLEKQPALQQLLQAGLKPEQERGLCDQGIDATQF
jgi:hypothetical protein